MLQAKAKAQAEMVLVTFVAPAHPALATLGRPCPSATTEAPACTGDRQGCRKVG